MMHHILASCTPMPTVPHMHIYIYLYEKNEVAESNYILCMGGDSKQQTVETFEHDLRDLQC